MIAENGFFSKKNKSFLAATARSIYSSNFSRILKYSKSRGDTPIKSPWFEIDSPLTGTWVFGYFLNHYVSQLKKAVTTSVDFCYKLSSIKGLQQSFSPDMFLK